MASVTVRIPGSEDLTIVGKVLGPSLVAPVIPVSNGSVANIDVEPPAEYVEPLVELSVDNVKDVIKKFEPVEVCEAVDTVEVDGSSDDMVCDLAKLASWIESDSPFPPSALRDRVRRSKAWRKALKKKYDVEDECRCRNPACRTPKFGGPSIALSIPSSTSTAPSTSATSPRSASSAELGGRDSAPIEIPSPGSICVVPP